MKTTRKWIFFPGVFNVLKRHWMKQLDVNCKKEADSREEEDQFNSFVSDFVNMKHSKEILSITSAAVDALSCAREVHKDKRAEFREGLEQAMPSVPRTRKDVTQPVSSRHQNPLSPLNQSLSSPTADDRLSDQVKREVKDESSSSLLELPFNGTQRVRVPSRLLREIKSPLERSSSSSDSNEAPGVIRIGKVNPEKRLIPGCGWVVLLEMFRQVTDRIHQPRDS